MRRRGQPRSLKQQQSWTILLVMAVKAKKSGAKTATADPYKAAMENVRTALEGSSAPLWILSHSEMTTGLFRTAREVQTQTGVTTQPIPAAIERQLTSLKSKSALVGTLRSQFIYGSVVIVTTGEMIHTILSQTDSLVAQRPYGKISIKPGGVCVLELIKTGQQVTLSLKKVID